MALPYDIVCVLLEEKFSSYNSLFKNSILPFLHQMEIDFHSLDGLFN
jgi:hypothetical protein